MTRGSITKRGKASWRIKFEAGRHPKTGERRTRYVTVKGKRSDADRELTRLLAQADAGTLVEPRKVTVDEWIASWFDSPHGLSAKTLERYRELATQQISPHLGIVPVQRLRPSDVATWHATLLASGGKDGRALSSRTVGHAHRVLRRALQRGVELEILARNVASAVKPPAIDGAEVEILDAKQIAVVIERLEGHELYAFVVVALGTGMRRGEILAWRWSDIDLDTATARVERALEETKDGLRFKPPKTKHGRRTIKLPASVVTALRAHRIQQLEHRMLCGRGKLEDDALVFAGLDGSPLSPRGVSGAWRRVCISLNLPLVMLHALRHTHVSVLIAAGVDVVQISRRLGHANPTITLNIYAHLFNATDGASAAALEAVMGRGERTNEG